MSRAKGFEDAVRKLLDVHGMKYISSKNQAVKCRRCKAYQQVRTQGFDFLVYWPRVIFIECKTGESRLTDAQKKMKEEVQSAGVTYVELHDTVDVLLDVLARKGGE